MVVKKKGKKKVRAETTKPAGKAGEQPAPGVVGDDGRQYRRGYEHTKLFYLAAKEVLSGDTLTFCGTDVEVESASTLENYAGSDSTIVVVKCTNGMSLTLPPDMPVVVRRLCELLQLKNSEELACIRFNVPNWFARPDFKEWLDRAAVAIGNGNTRLATWHQPGRITGEDSDIFCIYDAGELSESDMPDWAWRELTSYCSDRFGPKICIVWLTNLPDDE